MYTIVSDNCVWEWTAPQVASSSQVQLSDDYQAKLEKFGTQFEKTVIAPLAKGYKDAQKQLIQARNDATKAVGIASQSVIRVNVVKEAEKAKKDALRTRDQAVEETKHAIEQVKEEVKYAAEEVKKVTDLFINQELIVYKINTPIKFSLNMHTGGYHGVMDVDSLGITWDTGKIRELLNGNVVLPEINPVQLAAVSFGTKLKVTNEYKKRRDEYINKPGRLTYFASERFVDWAGGESVARFIGSAVIGKGDQALQEAKAQLLLEYDQLYSWLTIQGREASDELCAELLLAILEGRAATVAQVKMDSLQVLYIYEPEIVGSCFLPKALRENIESRFKSVIRNVQRKTNQHFAFGMAVECPDCDKLLRDIVDSYSKLEMTGPEELEAKADKVIQLLLAKTGNEDLRRFLGDVQRARNPSVRADAVLKTTLVRQLGINQDELAKWFVPGKPIIDLTNTPLAAKIEPLFKRLPQGNKGSVTVSRLEFNLTTYTLNLELNVAHCHSWGSLKGWFQ